MERRNQPRANFGRVLFNKYIDGLPHAVELLELSTTGMLVRKIHEPDVPRDFYSLELGLPGCAERIWLWARKVWTKENRQALRFVGIDPRDRERLDAIVREALAAAQLPAVLGVRAWAMLRAVDVLVIDNYDSFTYNLVQYLRELGAETRVVKNDEIAVDDIRSISPSGLLVSPGPCTPDDAGISLAAIEQSLAGTVPILGVCLGHQAIGQAFGGKVVRAERLMHGKTSPIEHDGRGIFDGLPCPFEATRYHSLVVERSSLPACLVVTAWTREGEIMGLRHASLDVEGVQFHPESFLTVAGKALLANWTARLALRRGA